MTSSTTPDADYAFWVPTGSSFRLTYSLAAFHEIEFVVSEGYRRIPHGGVETGGLLFGCVEGNNIRIEAFRPIECEHASGPSFNLSERDVTALEKQISSAASDAELSSWEVIGWFIAHTRGPLKMTEAETRLFAKLFPGAGKLTVLVKPERFHPTRFVFLPREKDGRVSSEAAVAAIILPGRGTGREGPIPSIAVPPDAAQQSQAGNRVPAPKPRSAVSPAEEPQRPNDTKLESRPPVQPLIQHAATRHSTEPASAAERTPPPLPARISEVERIAPLQRGEAWAAPNVQPVAPQIRQRGGPTVDEEPRGYGAHFALVLLISALLGCCVGYWAYLQLPPPVIPLNVHAVQGALSISWPASQTRGTGYAAIRVNDGNSVALSPADKERGGVSVANNGDDVKIELFAQHWLRDSRGIVRFVKPQASPTPGATQLP